MVVAALMLAAALGGVAHSFKVDGGKFLLDGKPFQIIAGEIHYVRMPRPLWRQRIQMARAMGLNAVSTYCFWNVHEPEKGKFDFRGQNDVAAFVRECQRQRMWVVLRPGPYACAEWDFGGYPYWLLNEGLTIRSRDPKFLAFEERYLSRLADQLRPLQVSRGGPILLTQIENEYGSYGNDREYMRWHRDVLRRTGFQTPLFVAEGGDQLKAAWIEGAIAGVNGGDSQSLRKVVDQYAPGGPYFVPEFYPGWLDHWGEPKSKTDGDVDGYRKLLETGASVNLYMFHGGTNFGYMAGANHGDRFQPDLTSYDYDAPLDEAGRPTPKFFKFREAIQASTGRVPSPIPAVPRVVRLPRFTLEPAGSPLDDLSAPVQAEMPLPMERLHQAFGFVLYRKTVHGPILGDLKVEGLRDFAVALLDGKPAGTLDRREPARSLAISVPEGRHRLELWAENCGRINYGRQLPDNLKGITGTVSLGSELLKGWEMFPMPLSKPGRLTVTEPRQGPRYYRGSFKLLAVGEIFLDLRGWGKGVVWVNGHNLGRYWNIGPQQTLFVPSCWLRSGLNHVVALEQLEVKEPTMQGLAEPILDQLAQKG